MNRMLYVAVVVLLGVLNFVTPARPETLVDAWGQALANNPQLAASESEAAACEYVLQASRAQRLPTINLRGSYAVRSDEPSFLIDNPLTPSVDSFAYAQDEFAAAEAVFNAPLYTGGTNKYSILRSEATLHAAKETARRTRQDLLLSVGEAYVEVLRAHREMEVAEHDVITRQSYQSDVQKKYEQERVPKADLLEAQVTLSAAIQNRLKHQHRLEVVRAAYNRLVNRPLLTQFQLEELGVPWLPHGFEELVQIAWQSRPELMELQATADARLFEAKRLQATQLPQVNAIGRHLFEENRFQDPNGIASAAVVIDWNPFDGGRATFAAQSETARATAALRQLEDVKSRVSLQLLTNWNDRQEALERREVALLALQQAEENVRVSQMRYAQGLALQSELLDAQTRRTEATRSYYNAIYDQTLAELRLRHSCGVLESMIP